MERPDNGFTEDKPAHNPPDEDWADDLPAFALRQGPAEAETQDNPFAMDPPQVPFTLTIPTLDADRFHNLDDVMLHAAFAVLRQFLETEYPGRVLWRKSDLAELEERYRWWERTSMIMWPHNAEQDRADDEMLIRLVRIRHIPPRGPGIQRGRRDHHARAERTGIQPGKGTNAAGRGTNSAVHGECAEPAVAEQPVSSRLLVG